MPAAPRQVPCVDQNVIGQDHADHLVERHLAERALHRLGQVLVGQRGKRKLPRRGEARRRIVAGGGEGIVEGRRLAGLCRRDHLGAADDVPDDVRRRPPGAGGRRRPLVGWDLVHDG